MNRSIEFTKTFVAFCTELLANGYVFKIAEVRRDELQQYYYYLIGRSKCDGINRRSAHQDVNHAADLDFYDEKGRYYYPDKEQEAYLGAHELWQKKYGGEPLISWDIRHFSL